MKFWGSGSEQSPSTVLRPIVVIAGIICTIGLIGGIYLAFAERVASIEFSLFGNRFSSTNTGVAVIFICAVTFILVYRRVLKSIDHLSSSGGSGGAAEVIGNGEARGGKGGNSGSFGPGGSGGNARVDGGGKAIGGSGGNGG